MNRRDHPEPDSRTSAAIDAALRSLGDARPACGLEGRILTRLAAARTAADTGPGELHGLGAWLRRSGFAAPALGLATGCLLAVVIVVGSISHSRRIHTGPITAPPALELPVRDIGAASAVHLAAPVSAPVPAGPAARGRSTRHSTHGRARIGAHARKAPGVAVPSPASVPQN